MIVRNRSLIELYLQIADAAISQLREVAAFFYFCKDLLGGVREAVCHPSKVKWKTTAYYMDCCGSDAMPIISLLGFLIGVILAFQAIVQLGRFGVENYVVNLVGTVITTELAPLVTAIVLAGRTSSNFAAEIGSMKASEEIAALETMGMDIRRFLVMPKILALLVITPGLTIISVACGIVGGMTVVCSRHSTTVAEYFSKTFDVIQPVDLTQGIVKSIFFSLIVGAVGCLKGLNAAEDAQGVGRSATSAVVTAIFIIVITDAILTACFGMLP